jgi:hypothetical protein
MVHGKWARIAGKGVSRAGLARRMPPCRAAYAAFNCSMLAHMLVSLFGTSLFTGVLFGDTMMSIASLRGTRTTELVWTEIRYVKLRS